MSITYLPTTVQREIAGFLNLLPIIRYSIEYGKDQLPESVLFEYLQ